MPLVCAVHVCMGLCIFMLTMYVMMLIRLNLAFHRMPFAERRRHRHRHTEKRESVMMPSVYQCCMLPACRWAKSRMFYICVSNINHECFWHCNILLLHRINKSGSVWNRNVYVCFFSFSLFLLLNIFLSNNNTHFSTNDSPHLYPCIQYLNVWRCWNDI